MGITMVLVCVLIFLVSFVFYLFKKRMSYWKDVGIAHNEPSLWLGNFQGFKTTRSFGDCVRDTYEQFKGTGPFCGFYFFQRPAVVVLKLDLKIFQISLISAYFTMRGMIR